MTKTATCIECGCADHNACVDDADGGACYWLVVDRTAGLGVCSSCPDARARWEAGDREVVVRIRQSHPPTFREDADVLAETSFGKAALQKLAPVPEGFRFFRAGWIGRRPEDWREMKFTGQQYTVATQGRRRGLLVVPVPGTTRSVRVSRGDAAAVEESHGFGREANCR